jgi:hypothetical protein
MAVRVTCTFVIADSYGKKTKRTYQSRLANPADADVQDLAGALQAFTALSVIKATVNREVDISGQTTAAAALSSRQKDASLVFEKSGLRNSHIGQYTFNMPEPKAALVDGTGKIDLTAAAVTGWRERFDDGSGVPAVVGDWYVSDGEELIEDEDPVDGFLNKD